MYPESSATETKHLQHQWSDWLFRGSQDVSFEFASFPRGACYTYVHLIIHDGDILA